MHSARSGFTLVELLVVISIISILSVIGITIYSGVQKSARDARRRMDIDAIATALEVSRNPGAANYGVRGAATILPLPSAFGNDVVPTDTTTSKYCINLVPTGDQSFPKFASGWPSGDSCGNGDYWQLIPATGYLASSGTGIVIEGWHVCARLESSTGSLISSGLQVYCRSSQQ